MFILDKLGEMSEMGDEERERGKKGKFRGCFDGKSVEYTRS